MVDGIVPLAHAHHDRVSPLYRGDREDVAIHAVLTGRSPGKVFVDDAEAPRTALVWSPLQGIYLGGDAGNRRFVGAYSRFLDDIMVPLARAGGETGLDMSGVDPSWDPVLERLLASRAPVRSVEMTFRLLVPDRWSSHGRAVDLPEGLRLVSIGQELFGRAVDDEGHPLANHWCGYGAFEADGLGYCLLDEWGHIISTCAAGFGAGGFVDATVSTAEGYRRQGLATRVATAFVRGALTRGWTPVWHCMARNAPSAALARKLGFSLARRTTLYSFWF